MEVEPLFAIFSHVLLLMFVNLYFSNGIKIKIKSSSRYNSHYCWCYCFDHWSIVYNPVSLIDIKATFRFTMLLQKYQ